MTELETQQRVASPQDESKCPKCKTKLTGRHCLACGFSHAIKVEAMKPTRILAEDQEIERVRVANDIALQTALRDAGVTLPRNDRGSWQATARTRGTVGGLEHLGELTVLATDGMLGLFTDADARPHFLHVGWFTGEVRPCHGVDKRATPSRGAATPRRRECVKRDRLLAML